MFEKSKKTGTTISWKQLLDSFTSRYTSITKQTKISNRLKALQIEDVREDNDDDYAALYRLTKRINELAPVNRFKGRAYEAKVRFLTKEVAETTWWLKAQRRIPPWPSFKRLTDLLYTAMGELGAFHKGSSASNAERKTGSLWKSLWRNEKDKNK